MKRIIDEKPFFVDCGAGFGEARMKIEFKLETDSVAWKRFWTVTGNVLAYVLGIGVVGGGLLVGWLSGYPQNVWHNIVLAWPQHKLLVTVLGITAAGAMLFWPFVALLFYVIFPLIDRTARYLVALENSGKKR